MKNAWALLLLAVVLTSCGGPTSIQISPEISNQSGEFSFLATGAVDASQTLEYTWENQGVGALVNLSNAIGSDVSSGTLIILDAAGRPVYSSPLAQSGVFETAYGSSPGARKIRVVLNHATGNIDFQIKAVYCLNFHCGIVGRQWELRSSRNDVGESNRAQ